MSHPGPSDPGPEQPDAIARRAKRLARAREQKSASPLIGLSAFGVIGWSVAVPTVIGAFAGRWLNKHAPQPFSWTLALMLAGLVLGIIYAWHWVNQNQSIVQDEESDD